MDPIKTSKSKSENAVLLMDDTRKKIAKTVTEHAGVFCSTLILLVAAVVLTTNVSLSSFAELRELTKTFIILMFLNYMMFFSCADNGTTTGLKSDTYKTACIDYDELKKQLMAFPRNMLTQFCRHYVEEEQKAVRASILIEAGLTLEDMEKCKGKSSKAIKEEFSSIQRKAIKRALKIKALKLNPDMICKRGRAETRRHPFGTNPRHSKLIKYSINIVRITITSILTCAIVLETLVDFTWAAVAEVLIKLLPVVLNGFNGYKLGLENIIIDSVNYMGDQMDLMRSALEFNKSYKEA